MKRRHYKGDSQGLLLIVVSSISEIRGHVAAARKSGQRIGFVPTMGALHAGHVSLMEAARRDGGQLVVSIYVNPTQFGAGEDFTAYPRTMEADLHSCEKAGAAFVFTPTNAEMYPPGEQTRVHPGRLADRMCGPFRPGHFEGVCTVVTKLFNIVQPDIAYFGQKDAQQAIIIQKMVEDLRLPIRVVVCPIVREPDGLAKSSRNVYLSAEERSQALCLFRALTLGSKRLKAGERRGIVVISEMTDEIKRVGGSGIVIEYVVAMNPETLEPLESIGERVLLAVAVRIGKTRLIDNMIVKL